MSGKPLDAIVIGAGQSGLAAAYHLRRRGLRHVLLEASDAPGGSWPRYYESLRLFSAARYDGLPGMKFPGDPAALPERDAVTAYLRSYAEAFGFDVETGCRVERVSRSRGGFAVEAADGRRWRAGAVIVATGAFTTPNRPRIEGMDGFRGEILHSSEYRRPDGFAGRRVVVVGGGNSGVQIAAELLDTADVTLATRGPVRFMPRRIMGRDLHFWLKWSGMERCRWLGSGASPVIDTDGYADLVRSGRLPHRDMFERFTPDGVLWADGRAERVDAVVLATGFREHFPFLDTLPGAAEHRRGVSTGQPGIYFVGRSGQNGMASATLRGSGRDARIVVRHLERSQRRGDRRASAERSLAAAG